MLRIRCVLMPVFALWRAPRARSTALFRSMVERGDMVVVHEPFGDLAGLGEPDVEGRPFDSLVSLLVWLRDCTQDVNVFLKDTLTADTVRSSPIGAFSPRRGTRSSSAVPRRSLLRVDALLQRRRPVPGIPVLEFG